MRLRLATLSATFWIAAACSAGANPSRPTAPAPAPSASASAPVHRHAKPALDLSGKRRTGKASVYAHHLEGRRMADGTRLDPRDDTAASKTLPLGTTARVTNVETGQSTVVTIRDRGPYVKGRIVDLSPSAASKVGIGHRQGVSRVEVTPIALPPRP